MALLAVTIVILNPKSPILQCSVLFYRLGGPQQHDAQLKTYANLAGMVFYSELYNKVQHFGVLPQSVDTMEGVNDLKNPIDTMDKATALARFQYRLWVAPFTKITFSSDAPLLDLGFTPEQFGQRTVFKQITITGCGMLVSTCPPKFLPNLTLK